MPAYGYPGPVLGGGERGAGPAGALAARGLVDVDVEPRLRRGVDRGETGALRRWCVVRVVGLGDPLARGAELVLRHLLGPGCGVVAPPQPGVGLLVDPAADGDPAVVRGPVPRVARVLVGEADAQRGDRRVGQDRHPDRCRERRPDGQRLQPRLHLFRRAVVDDALQRVDDRLPLGQREAGHGSAAGGDDHRGQSRTVTVGGPVAARRVADAVRGRQAEPAVHGMTDLVPDDAVEQVLPLQRCRHGAHARTARVGRVDDAASGPDVAVPDGDPAVPAAVVAAGRPGVLVAVDARQLGVALHGAWREALQDVVHPPQARTVPLLSGLGTAGLRPDVDAEANVHPHLERAQLGVRCGVEQGPQRRLLGVADRGAALEVVGEAMAEHGAEAAGEGDLLRRLQGHHDPEHGLGVGVGDRPVEHAVAQQVLHVRLHGCRSHRHQHLGEAGRGARRRRHVVQQA